MHIDDVATRHYSDEAFITVAVVINIHDYRPSLVNALIIVRFHLSNLVMQALGHALLVFKMKLDEMLN